MGAFGNVPDEDVEAVRRMADLASSVVDALPKGAPSSWVAVTYETVLDAVMENWVESVGEELESEDAEDIENIVRAAADVALQQQPSFQDTAYRIILKRWLEDWVTNWDGEE